MEHIFRKCNTYTQERNILNGTVREIEIEVKTVHYILKVEGKEKQMEKEMYKYKEIREDIREELNVYIERLRAHIIYIYIYIL